MKRLLPSYSTLLLSVLLCSISTPADDALREVDRDEAVEISTDFVVARNTGRSGSVEEKQKEGYSCTFRYEMWVFESLLMGTGPWKSGDSLRVFDGGQQQDCWRGHEYKTKGLDIGLMLPYYQSPTILVEQGAGARGILLGGKRKVRDFELVCPRAIERPDQADTLKKLVKRKP